MANILKDQDFSFCGGISLTQTNFRTQPAAAASQVLDPQRNFKLLTEWAESTAREKTAQKREENAL